MTRQLPAWRRAEVAGVSTEIEGLSGAQLRAVAALWRRSGRELTSRFGGSSMEPTIPAGAEVVVRCGVDPAPGDIIAFVHGDQVVVHRVVGLSTERRWILTRGDAHVIPDVPLREPDAVIGVVEGVKKLDDVVVPAPAPRSLPRRLALAVCLVGLRLHPSLGQPVVRVLRFACRRLLGLRSW